MNWTVAGTCLLIILARIGDVSLGTIRTLCIVQGRAVLAWCLGFVEILIWIFAVSAVLTNLQEPVYAVAYAFGFATGSYAGIKIEGWLAFGRQVVRVFTHTGEVVADRLREGGYLVSSFDAEDRNGRVKLLFIEVPRRKTPCLLRQVAEYDPECYYLVDDIRLAAHPTPLASQPTGWRAVMKKK